MKNLVAMLLTTTLCSLAFADTALNKSTVQGEYLIKGKDVYLVARVALGKAAASMTLRVSEGDVVCKGKYKFDENNMTVVTQFNNCAGTTVSHTINLEGQTVESLKENPVVAIAIEMGSESIPAIPFNIQKLK